MKKLLILLIIPLLLCSCRTGDLLTLYTDDGYGGSDNQSGVSTSSPTPSGAITLVSMTEEVNAGDVATVTVMGEANKKYSITVHYSSGESVASGLESKTSSSDGTVSWSWKVGARTRAGSYKIEIRCENELLTLYFKVV